jgi:hypothetical protein
VWTGDQKKAIRDARSKEERKRKPQPLKMWLTDYANANDMLRANAVKLWNAARQADYRAKLR